jgi:hypothetical protein
MLILLSTLVVSCSEEQTTAVETKDKTRSADTVYTNGKIYTVNEAQPWAEAVAIRGGKFIAVGSASDVKAVTGDSTEVIDLKGAFVMPGIQENHVHASSAGATILKHANRATFTPENTPEEIRQILLDYAKANPGDGWIHGQQWGNAHFPDGRARNDFLDDIFPDRPVYLIDESAHNAVVNSKGLELAGITAETRSRKQASSRRTLKRESPRASWRRWVSSRLESCKTIPMLRPGKRPSSNPRRSCLPTGLSRSPTWLFRARPSQRGRRLLTPTG